jgi:4-amino-4-deoxy-L-arabinose transferase-like glycosyltransferase
VDDYTKREWAIVAGITIATVLVTVVTFYLIGRLVFDRREPLTKAGGLEPTQDIRKVK